VGLILYREALGVVQGVVEPRYGPRFIAHRHQHYTSSNKVTITTPTMVPSPPSSSCPFCRIASTYPRSPSSKEEQGHGTVSGHHDQSSNSTFPNTLDAGDSTPAHLILSTDSVLAFLDIMPLTRGHVLLVTREHYEKLSDVDVGVAREV
jgi:hypothetical protein